MAKAYWLWIAAVAGATVLALEVLTARVLAPTFGTGPVAWSALLAVALGTLATGNLVGGPLAERRAPEPLIVWLCAVAAVALAAFSQMPVAVARLTASLPLVEGAIATALLSQALPIGALGAITPSLLATGPRDRPSGRWAGAVLAAGSGGGIAGALVVALVLLPRCGIARSYLLLSAAVVLSALPLAIAHKHRLATLLLVATLAGAAWCGCARTPKEPLQSQFSELEVVSNRESKVLLIDGLPQTGLPVVPDGAELRPGDGLRYGYLLEAALFSGQEPRSALVVGLGGGLAPRLLAAHGLTCEAVEQDPAVVELARREFQFTGPVHVADGRWFLARTERRWDLIFLDVCTSERLAWHLFTVEAMQLIRHRLNAEGLLVVQLVGDDGPWSASVVQTVESVFGPSALLAAPAQWGAVGPRWLFAARDSSVRLPQTSALAEGLLPEARLSTPWRQVTVTRGGALLTDDRCPAELDWARTARSWRLLWAVGRSSREQR